MDPLSELGPTTIIRLNTERSDFNLCISHFPIASQLNLARKMQSICKQSAVVLFFSHSIERKRRKKNSIATCSSKIVPTTMKHVQQ